MNAPLLEYLKNVQKLEEARYECEAGIERIENLIENEKIQSQKQTVSYPPKPFLVADPEPVLKKSKIWWWILSPITGYVCLIIWIILAAKCIINRCTYKKALNEYNIRKLQSQKNYEKALAEYQKKCDEIDREYLKEQKISDQKCEQYRRTIFSLQNTANELSSALEQVYSANIIHPKYRDFVAVTTFYEYFDTEQCNELIGENGAYRLYENEIRANRIITKLDNIVHCFDQVNAQLRSTQYMLYNSITEVNNSIDCLANKLDDQNEINAHNARLIAQKVESLTNIEKIRLDEAKDSSEKLQRIEEQKLYELRKLNDN